MLSSGRAASANAAEVEDRQVRQTGWSMTTYFDKIIFNCIADKYKGVFVQLLRRVLHDECCMIGDVVLMECSTATRPLAHHITSSEQTLSLKRVIERMITIAGIALQGACRRGFPGCRVGAAAS